MKNINKKYIFLGIIILSLLFFLIVLIFLFKDKDTKKNINEKIKENRYVIIKNDKYSDATIITNDKLKSEHCINNICIKDLVIYKGENYCNIELKILNKGENEDTGFLKVVLDNKEMMVYYDRLASGMESNFTIVLDNENITKANDYTVINPTDEEINEIRVS